MRKYGGNPEVCKKEIEDLNEYFYKEWDRL